MQSEEEEKQQLTDSLWIISIEKGWNYDDFSERDEDARSLIKQGANVLEVLKKLLGNEEDGMLYELINWAREAGYGKMSPNEMDELAKTKEGLMTTVERRNEMSKEQLLEKIFGADVAKEIFKCLKQKKKKTKQKGEKTRGGRR